MFKHSIIGVEAQYIGDVLCIIFSSLLPSSDGVGRTGTFICLHAQLERLKSEGAVNFFQYIKSAGIHRAGLVDCVVGVCSGRPLRGECG